MRKILLSTLTLALLIFALVPSQIVSAASTATVFNTPVGADAPGPAFPGDTYTATFTAAPGYQLSFATMLVQTNDYFYAPNEWGIPLFDSNGNPTNGDVTHYVELWDSGTEINEEPGVGENQAPRQAGPDTGPVDPNNNVRRAANGFGVIPAVNEMIQVTLAADGNNTFTLNITNISGDSSFASPLAPGVAVLHTEPAPLFTNNAPDRGLGLEALAEDGNPATLAANIGTGNADDGADNGDDGADTPAPANNNILVFAVPAGADGPAPAFPGEAYEFTFSAEWGDHLSFATMLVQTNDLFFAPDEWGIPLYDSAGNAYSGNITNYVHLWDAGTEQNEVPGVGPNQAPRQAGPNTGPTDTNRLVRRAHDNYGIIPAVNQLINVTLTYHGDDVFTVRIENVAAGAYVSPLAPGLAIVHRTYAPLFQTGFYDRDLGLEQIAEDGDPSRLYDNLMAEATTLNAPENIR